MARDSECLFEIVPRRKFVTASGAAGVAALAGWSSGASESGCTPKSGGECPESHRVDDVTGTFG